MGMFDTIHVNCPVCGEEHEFQSKSGECLLRCYSLDNCPDDVLINANRHSPNKCDCGSSLSIDVYNRKVINNNL